MKSVLVAGIAGAFVSLATEASTLPKYTLSPLASLGKSGNNTWTRAVNEAGRVVGYSMTAYERCEGGTLCSYQHAVFWSDGIAIDQHPFESPGVSTADDLNNIGQAVGGWDDGTQSGACIWQDGSVTFLPSLGGHTRARAVNDVGQIVGWSAVPVEQNRRAVLWQNGELFELGTYPGGIVSYAEDINDAGQIVGTGALVGTSTDRRATLWQGGAMLNLGTLPGGAESFGVAINNAGQIVGRAVKLGLDGDRAVMWQKDPLTDEWTISSLDDRISRACDINDWGQIVGQAVCLGGTCRRAVLWENGQVFDLNDLIPGETGWTLHRAMAINNAGQIAGRGRDAHGNPKAFLLTPIATRPCPTDMDADGVVGPGDLADVMTAWGTNPGGPPDFDGDGVVAIPDLLTLLAAWGSCP